MIELVVVKLGGSLITDKRQPRTQRREVMARLARELRVAWKEGDWQGSSRLLLSHGSGSFGHFAALEAGFGEAPDIARRLAGLGAVQSSAALLHQWVMESLVTEALPVFSMAPSSFLVTRNGEVSELALAPLELALDSGLLPVLYGDVVLDREQGAAIFSTESVLTTVIGWLHQRGRYRVREALWLGETDGVHDEEGRTLEELSVARLEEMVDKVEGASGFDVTGGMRHRLEVLRGLLDLGVESRLANGLERGTLLKMLRRTELPGTKVPLPRVN